MTYDQKNKMNPAFRTFEGGLFAEVEKADVGDGFERLQESGVDMMSWADPFMPDAAVPQHVKQAALNAMNDPIASHYTAPVGNTRLREQIARRWQKRYGMRLDPQRNILITPGSDSALYFAMLPFIETGDEVIVCTPCYPNNLQNIKMMGAKAVYCELQAADGYQIRKEALEACVSEQTKMIVLTHPNNPTTTVFDQRSLEAVRDLVLAHDLILVVDQAFEDFTFEQKMLAPAAMADMFAHTVTVCSTSKGYGLSGYRVGYIIADDVFMDVYYGCAVSVIGATNTVSQLAVLAAMEDESFMQEFEAAYDWRRHQAAAILSGIPGVKIQLPQSGFLCWVDVSGLADSSEVCARLLSDARVSVNDGKNYGPGGEKGFRIVLGVYRDNERVRQALLRIREVLLQMAQEKGLSVQ
ncbi:MAG TPA: pyridoxal phosphate-dependent aminotransferase [Candidatus Merdibacter merdavium]|uniref:Aminotransferase n=1 Tax=Candidatus Merdibacter merdavium TaxID=2838692 RepID=A0A9D2NQB8_9FIRM|nr:pyridoxal phosphate-dependent aminotransferase [Candidatus Merdibacter merdavium]